MAAHTNIHPTAIVADSARLAEDVVIGPYAVIGEGVRMGSGCRVMAHVVIDAGAVIGVQNQFFPHAVIGTDSQDAKYQGEDTRLVIGDDNIFREFVTINRATGAGSQTRIGNHCRFLAYSHVAHNCRVENGVVLANCAELGGEVVVEQNAILGGLVGVHQFCHIGAYAIVGACSKVTQDILPFVTADGHPARPRGLNRVGLKRNGFSGEQVQALKQMYRLLFLKSLPMAESLKQIEGELGESEDVSRCLRFIQASQRKLSRPRGDQAEAELEQS